MASKAKYLLSQIESPQKNKICQSASPLSDNSQIMTGKHLNYCRKIGVVNNTSKKWFCTAYLHFADLFSILKTHFISPNFLHNCLIISRHSVTSKSYKVNHV